VLDEIGDKEVEELDTLEFTATARRMMIFPAQELVFRLRNGESGEVPEGAEITSDGAFSWTPGEEEGPGTYHFDVCVSDGALVLPDALNEVALSDCETITVTVTEVNVAPVLAPIGNQEGNELEELTFTATASELTILSRIGV
jgi:hypothetical protein